MAQSVRPPPADPVGYAPHFVSPSDLGRMRAHSVVAIDVVSAHYCNPARWTGTSILRQHGGTTLGILIGIVIGLAIAVVTAMFVTRTALPFVGQATKSSERSAAAAATPQTAAVPDAPTPKVPVAAGDVPDPNRTAASRQREAPGQAPLQRTEVATVDATSPQPPLQVSSSTPVAAPAPSGAPAGDSGNAPIRAATPSTGSARSSASAPSEALPAPQASAAQTDRSASYLLQAGAFRGVDDADAMKLRLALMGLEAQIVSADVNGTTLHRVRVGPYVGLDAMNRARARLGENGVEATVLRQR